MTQFDLSTKELDVLLSKRWNFSTPTTKIARPESTSQGTESPKKERNNGLLQKETVEEAFRRLSENFSPEALMKSKRPSIPRGVPESPLPLDSPIDCRVLIVKVPSILVQEEVPDTPDLLKRDSSIEEHLIMNIPRRVSVFDL